MFGAVLPIAGAILGGIAGGQGSKQSSRSSSSSSVNLRDINDLNRGRSALEATAADSQLNEFKRLQQLLSGSGQQDAQFLQQGTAASQGLGDLLQSQLASGGLPSQAQVDQGNQFASQIFDPQRVALQQSFSDQDISAKRLAARLGRAGNDPILRAKLAQEQTRQQSSLSAQQGAYGAEVAQGLPQRQVQLAEALAQVRGNLAQQALTNRQTLLSMGNQLASSERQYRLQSAGQSQTGSQSQSSGGGLGGAIAGGLAGFGGFASAAGNLSSMFGAGGLAPVSSLSQQFASAPTTAPIGGGGPRSPFMTRSF